MANTKINQFKGGWKLSTNQGRIAVKLSDGSSKTMNFTDPAEFSAVYLMLSNSADCYLDKAKGVILSGPEDVFE